MDQFMEFIRNALDVVLIASSIYFILRFLKGSRAMNVLYGFITLGLIYGAAKSLGLLAFTEMVNRVAGVLVIIAVIVFQSEIRHGLARLGVHPFFQRVFQPHENVVRSVVKAAYRLAAKRNGGLIILTRQAGLKVIADSGIYLNAEVSGELLEAIFNPYSPLHDGAVIISHERIVAAACLLPLSEKIYPKTFGTRHLAGVGISEDSDALVLIISEERGKVSLAVNGELRQDLNSDQMNNHLSELLAGIDQEDMSR